jgi:hypothetical protein
MATVTPVPSRPAAHAVGAPIAAVLSARLAFTLPSSHTLATFCPKETVRCGATIGAVGARDPHTARAFFFGALTAVPLMLGSSRATVVPAGAGVGAAVVWVTISGIPSLCWSSYPWASSPVMSNRRRSSTPAARYGIASSGMTYRSCPTVSDRTPPGAPCGRVTSAASRPPPTSDTRTTSPVMSVTVRTPLGGGVDRLAAVAAVGIPVSRASASDPVTATERARRMFMRWSYRRPTGHGR